MKSKVQKIFIAFLSSVFAFVLVLSAFVVFDTTLTAYASVEEDGLVVSELDADFFTNANTYPATITQKVIPGNNPDGDTYMSVSYDMNNKRQGVTVSQGVPQVTFLTHGLNGGAHHWSNDFADGDNFEYTENSILELLGQKAECNYYLASFEYVKNSEEDNTAENNSGENNTAEEDEDFVLQIEKLTLNNNNAYDKVPIDKITDNTKHSVVVFDAYNAGQSNDYIYTQFNIMASKVVSDLQALDINNALPRVNLIGFSRGGLTNMQYALDHPDLVDSIFSLDTPYIGSTSASIDVHILAAIGHQISGGEGENDIVNPAIYLNYLNRWNNNYETLYKDINVHAIGCYESLDLIIYELFYQKLKTILDIDEINIAYQLLCRDLSLILMNLVALPNLSESVISQVIMNLLYTVYPQLKDNYTFVNGITGYLDLVLDEIQFNYKTLGLDVLNDGLVDLPSQLGTDEQTDNEYRGFTRYVKRFSQLSNLDFEKASTTSTPVTHNLVARNVELLSYIVKNIDIAANESGSPFLVSSVGNNPDDVKIIGYIGKNVEGTLTIPNTIDGRNVVAIGSEAFSNNLNGETDITKVVIPASVREIENNAFANNQYLTEITFESGSALTTICDGAFSYIPNLSNFTIPSNVDFIGERVFEKSGITAIQSQSANYTWQNNILINNNVTDITNKIAIYVNPLAETITFPDNVGSIAAYLFYGNENINQINLNQVEYIGVNAFAYSTLATLNQTENVIEASLNSFIQTPWLENQTNDCVTIGDILISYNGDEENIEIPEGIKKVGANAFVMSAVQTVVLPSSIESIGRLAFGGCYELDWILINSLIPPMLDGNCFEEDIPIYVKGIALQSYEDNIFFSNIDNSISTKSVNLKFYDINGELLGEKEEEYYSTFDNYVVAPVIDGYSFSYWIDNNGNQIYVNDIFDYYQDMELTPVYEPNEYLISLGEDDITAVYGEEVDFGRPAEDGKEFIGWFDNFGNQITNATGVCEWTFTYEIEYLEPRFELIIYTISYASNRNDVQIDTTGLPTQFTIDNPVTLAQLNNPQNFGYVFQGWYYNENKFESSFGIYNDIALTAKWAGDVLSYTNAAKPTINNKYAIIDLSNATGSGYFKFTIASSVKYVTFLGNSTLLNMQIFINTREEALVLGLKNIEMTPSDNSVGLNAISASGVFNLYLTYAGINTISGKDGSNGVSYGAADSQAGYNNDGADGNDGLDGENGGNGINAYSVFLVGFDEESTISIEGGAGGNGGDGQDGQAGSDGVNPPRGSTFNPIDGDDGANGGDGGNGGNGGNGGYAISATFINVNAIGSFSLKGGDGGNGGTGGNGGDGGDGTSDNNNSPFNGVGAPGDGGDAGYGGAPGDGGNGSAATTVDGIKGTGGEGGTCGEWGTYGLGGAGGSGGAFGDDGADGRGRNNTDVLESEGYSGANGDDVDATADFVELPDLFNEELFDEIA